MPGDKPPALVPMEETPLDEDAGNIVDVVGDNVDEVEGIDVVCVAGTVAGVIVEVLAGATVEVEVPVLLPALLPVPERLTVSSSRQEVI